jgi:hypothetical protein
MALLQERGCPVESEQVCRKAKILIKFWDVPFIQSIAKRQQ